MSAIVAHGHAALCGIAALGKNDLGQRLGRLGDHKGVHPVDTGTHHAAKSRRTEGKRHIKTVLDLLLISGNGKKLCLHFGAKALCGKPLFIFNAILLHAYNLRILKPNFSYFTPSMAERFL